MNDKFRNVVMAILIGLVAGTGLLVGISTVVSRSLEPTVAAMTQLNEAQVRLEQKVQQLAEEQKRLAERPAMPAFQPPAPPPEDTTVYEIPLGNSPVSGSADAPVTITEFSDLQCPFCSRFHDPLMEAVAAFPGKVRVVFKHFPLPFHPNARPAAKAVMAAGAHGKAYEMIGLILANQQQMSDEKYIEYAAQLGIDKDQFARDLKEKDAEWEKMIAEDEALVEKVNVGGTPTYLLNGKKTRARTVEQWKEQIGEALNAGPEQAAE